PESLLRIVDCYSVKAGKVLETRYAAKTLKNPTEINILLSESLSGVEEPMVYIDSISSLMSVFEDSPQLVRVLIERMIANLREKGKYSLVAMTSGVLEERLTRFIESTVDGIAEMRVVESDIGEFRRQLRYKSIREKHDTRWMFFNVFGSGVIGVTSIDLSRFENIGSWLCQRALESGCRMAWFGVIGEFFMKVHPVADAGFENGYLTTIDIDLNDPERGYGPTGTAARTGRPVIINDVAVEPSFEPWREEALRRGYYSCAAFPVNVGGRPIAFLTVCCGGREFPSGLIKSLESSVKDAEKSLSQASST
ncbi:GAF domain-containing protein, partial [Candidatus Bathyarchaeota archaeon]|nr:GAF domain-containing protein [Candidatus Bathyarchaeota archaeon]